MSNARLGLDIGGTNIKLARVVGTTVERRVNLQLDSAQLHVQSLIDVLMANIATLSEGVSELGVGVAAIVNASEGRVVASPNLPWLDGVDLAAALREATGLAVRLDNDVNCIGWGEACAGAGVGVQNQVCLALGTGMGGCIVVDGKLHRGHRGRAAELGHLPVAPHGPLCGCGGRGCVEQYSSKTGLLRLARQIGWRDERAQDDDVIALFAAAKDGDQRARWVVDCAAQALAIAICWCCEMLEPQRVIIAGGISAAWPQLRDGVQKNLRGRAHGPPRVPHVVVGTLGVDAGALGAALLFDG